MVFHVGLQAKIKLGRKSLDGRTVFLLSQSGSSLKPYSIFLLEMHTIVVHTTIAHNSCRFQVLPLLKAYVQLPCADTDTSLSLSLLKRRF